MWTAENRPRYNRDKLRYPSDLTDSRSKELQPRLGDRMPGSLFQTLFTLVLTAHRPPRPCPGGIRSGSADLRIVSF